MVLQFGGMIFLLFVPFLTESDPQNDFNSYTSTSSVFRLKAWATTPGSCESFKNNVSQEDF